MLIDSYLRLRKKDRKNIFFQTSDSRDYETIKYDHQKARK